MEPPIVHSSVKGGRKALDNGMVMTAPRIHVKNHHANLVIKFKVSYALLQQDTDITFLFYTQKYDIKSDVVRLSHRQYIFGLH